MYKIKSTSSGADLGMTEAPTYVRKTSNGCFAICPEPAKAQGIVFGGVVYNLLGREPMEEVSETVALDEVDAGSEISALQQTSRQQVSMTSQTNAAAKLYVQATAVNIADTLALEMPDLFKTWDEVLADGSDLAENEVINDGGQLYRVVQDGTTPQERQPPHGEGMLAVYRPIEPDHAGTQEDPIPWRYGMDCTQGKYYSYGGKTYLCNLTMPACVWAPGTEGLWQWSEVSA